MLALATLSGSSVTFDFYPYTTLVKYGKLGYIKLKPEKICGRLCVDRNVVYVGPGAVGVAPEIYDDDDDALKEILDYVTKATKK